MAHPYRSINDMMAQQSNGGEFYRLVSSRASGATIATATSGYSTVISYESVITMPTLTGYNYWWPTHITSFGAGGTGAVIGLITVGGTLQYTASTPTFTAGTAMPSRPMYDSTTGSSTSVKQLASPVPILVVTALGTITTPTITITYTDQDGNTGNTVALTLPTTPNARSSFFIQPHLVADRGIRAVTNITSSVAPTAWTIEIHLVYPLFFSEITVTSLANYSPSLVSTVHPRIGLSAGDVIGIYGIGSTSSSSRQTLIYALGDN